MQGHRQVVLDASQVQTTSELVSIGQVKICCDQSKVAYTVDGGDSTEAYNAIIQVIGMSGIQQIFTIAHPFPS